MAYFQRAPRMAGSRRAAALLFLCAVPLSALRPGLRVTRRAALQTAGVATLAVGVPLARASEYESGMLYVKAAEVKKVTTSYQPTFITYLSRFLLNYDRSSADWWRGQLRGVPLSLEREQLRSIRERQFGQFSASVEVGLQKYQGKAGVRSLFSFLRFRYGETKQAKLQLALLFSIISPRNQPSALIRRALAQADDGVVTAAEVLEGGCGYTSAESPAVVVSEPEGGGAAASVRAELSTTGIILSIMLDDGGSGYSPRYPPTVSISPPAKANGRRAQAVARVAPPPLPGAAPDVNQGRVVSLELTDRGRGYRKSDVVTVRFERDRDAPEAGVAPKASVELDYGVVRLVLEDGGKGYARDQPLSLDIAPPLLAGARGAIAKPRLAYSDLEALPFVGPFSDYYPEDSISAELLRLLPPSVRPTRRPLQGRELGGSYSFPLASQVALSEALERNGGKKAGLDVNKVSYEYAARTSSGQRQKLPFAVDRDPTFGPLGTSPVVREASLTTTDYLKFALSGAACTSLVRTALVPLDVAKTLMQSSPEAYPALRPAISSLWAQGGLPSLYRSIDVTAVAGFLLGGFGFGVNEFLRRYLGALGGPQAQAQYSLQISIAAALGSVIVTCLATSPFELLRLRAIEAASADALVSDAPAPTPAGAGQMPGGAPGPASPTPPPAAASATPASGSIARPLAISDDLETSAAEGATTLATLERLYQYNASSGGDLERDLERERERERERDAGGSSSNSTRIECVLPQTPSPQPASAYNVVNGLGTLYAEGGIGTLYSALTPLLLRELPFSITKYLVYDSSTQAIAAAFPLSQEGPLAQALLSLSGGLAAGVIAAAVSTPADTLLTLSQTPVTDADGCMQEPPTILQVAKDALTTEPLSLFNGLLPRCVFFGALIAGQFLLYDVFKSLFKVGTTDISFYLDVFASTDLPFRTDLGVRCLEVGCGGS